MSRLDELTERTRRTIERASAGLRPPLPVGPVSPVDGMPSLPPVPQMPAQPRSLAARRVSEPMPIVLGIDPGTATMGYAVVSPVSLSGDLAVGAFNALTYGVIETEAHTPMELRLLKIHDALRKLVQEYKPTQVAIEQLFFGRNVTTAVTVGQARGIALLVAAEAGLPVSEYKPAEVKHTVAGFGKADKPQVQRMVQTLLNLATIPRPDDAADALAIALCHLRMSRIRALGFR
jgi:crossover junction endodeoxyribonuclease RuvC